MREIHRSLINYLHKGRWRESFDVFFYQRLNKRLSKQLWGWWFEPPSRSLWRHCNVSMEHHQGQRWRLSQGCIPNALRYWPMLAWQCTQDLVYPWLGKVLSNDKGRYICNAIVGLELIDRTWADVSWDISGISRVNAIPSFIKTWLQW